MPTVINRQASDSFEQAVAPPAPESSDARRVSNRTTKGKPLIRFCHSGYVAFLITMLFLFLVNGADTSPRSSWNNVFLGCAYIRGSGALAPVGARNFA